MNRPNRPIRILMLLENQSFPDDVRVLLEAKSLVKAGFDVSVICPTGQSRKWFEKLGDIRVYRYPKPLEPRGFLGYVSEYIYSIAAMWLISLFLVFRRGFDTVHVHTPPDMTALIAIFYQLFGKRFVFDHHDLSPELYLARRGTAKPNRVYKVLRFFERLACRRADRLIATNATQQNVQTGRCGADPNDCYIVRNGPSEQMLGDVKPMPALCLPGSVVLGYVGVIGVQDGVDNLIRVVHELKTRHRRDDFITVIVGGGSALAGLKTLAQELDVVDLVSFIGQVPSASVPSYIAAFDICMTPDPSNPYNDSCATIKTMEYMALRKPTVCFRTRENQLTAGEAALYAANNDVAEFAEMTIRLMDDPALRESMGKIARQRMDDGFTWRCQSVRLLELYNELFNLAASGSPGLPKHIQDICE